MSDRPILLVEDSPDDVLLTRRAFQKNHIRNAIVVATDGAEAIAHLLPEDGSEGLHPALVLLDVKLPKVDGLEVLRRIRDDERTHHLPVVVLTTSNEERDILTSYRLGANSFLRKPVVFEEFVAAVNTLGVYWLLIPAGAR